MNTQHLCLICALSFSFSLQNASLGPRTAPQQQAKNTGSGNRPNLPWLTLKRCVQDLLNRTAEDSPSLSHLAGEHHGESASTGHLWNRRTRRHFGEKERERRRDAAVQKSPVLRWRIGLYVAALVKLCGAHWSPVDSRFQREPRKRIKCNS